MSTIDKVTPIKERQIKQKPQDRFDGKIANEIKNCNKLSKKFKKIKVIHCQRYL